MRSYTTPALNSAGGLGILWIATAAAVWTGLVPHAMSSTSFLWANAVLLVAVVGGVAFLKSLAPTRSIAHILHDAEHESEKSQTPPAAQR
jgi:hypothetical protein